MVKQLIGFLVLVIGSAGIFCHAAEPVSQYRYINHTGNVDDHAEYFIRMLRLSMEKSQDKYGEYELIPLTMPMRQDRQFKSLDADLLDVIWTVTSIEREQMGLPIRIPLLKGLIGHRVLVIDKQRANLFANINNKESLAQLSCLQGHDWPDVDILESAGFKVEKIVWHDTMYKLVSSGQVDYFPRSILEVFTEVEKANDPALYIEPHLMIVYPSALYFFVQKDNIALAERIEWGLMKAIEDGSFNRLFNQFPTHARALKALNVNHRKIIKIPNPLLPNSAPLNDKRFWATEVSFEASVNSK